MSLNPFGSFGVWVNQQVSGGGLVALAQRVEELGYTSLWIAGGVTPGALDACEPVLAATERLVVGTGIANMWFETPEGVTASYQRIEAATPGRLYVGLGVSHAPLVDSMSDQTYARPLAKSRAFLDQLDAQPDPVPQDRRLLAALGPKNVALAAERTLGSHPYLVTVENVRAIRRDIGDGVVAAELGVVLDSDLDRARAVGREGLVHYFGLPNYTNNWLRSGFTVDDLETRSDRLLDALLALGDADAIAARAQGLLDAGADHVCLQVVGPVPHDLTVLEKVAASLSL
jgi:probable F420-dependent oxidoreductase